jgi:hypothetical protein
MMNLIGDHKLVYDSAYNTAVSSGMDSDRARYVAINTVVNSFPRAIPREDIVSVNFQLEKQNNEIVIMTDQDEEYVSAILADTSIEWTEAELEAFAKSINEGTPVGDIDHEALKQMIRSGYTDAQIKGAVKSKRGIAKAVKALVQDGKLWVRLAIDKRYRNVIKKAEGLSIEALRTKGVSGSGQFLGFTFAVNEAPYNPNAVIVG